MMQHITRLMPTIRRVLIIVLASITLLVSGTHGEEPTWIQYSEPLAGENSPTFTDVLNRPAKTIWNNFLIEHDTNGYHNYSALAANMTIDMSSKLDVSVFESEHNPDGSHTFTIPSTTDDISEGANLYYTEARVSANSDVSANTTHRQTTSGNPHHVTSADVGASEWSLQGNGSGVMAQEYFATAPGLILGNEDFSVFMTVEFRRLGQVESLYRQENEYSATILEIYKNSSNQICCDIDGNSNCSESIIVTSDLFQPVSLGVSVEAEFIHIFIDGLSETFGLIPPETPLSATSETHILGNGLLGDIFQIWISDKTIPVSSFYIPGEGVHECPRCLLAYEFDEGSGNGISDSMGTSFGSGPGYSLSTQSAANWVEYTHGY